MIKHESRRYFKAIGAHLSVLRKSRGMTQSELARAIGVSQQSVFAYELGDRRVSVLILTKMAKVFNVSVEEMVGMSRPVRAPKGRLSPRAMRHAERLQALSKTQQRFVVRIMTYSKTATTVEGMRDDPPSPRRNPRTTRRTDQECARWRCAGTHGRPPLTPDGSGSVERRQSIVRAVGLTRGAVRLRFHVPRIEPRTGHRRCLRTAARRSGSA